MQYKRKSHPPTTPLAIAAVERETGLSKEALRIWERRYGFPSPARDPQGDRLYPAEQVARLRLLKRLMDQGHRPGKLMALEDSALARLSTRQPTMPAPAASPAGDALAPLLALVAGQQVDALRAALGESQLRLGLAAFVTDVLAPLTIAVGDAWAAGQLSIADEHLYTEGVQALLRPSLQMLAASERRAPRVLLATLPGELHTLGLLMAQVLLALEGCTVVSLGAQAPLADIAQAARRQQADVVALSFSLAFNSRKALAALAELRSQLPPSVAVWAGGACSAVHKRPPAGVTPIRDLREIGPAVGAWRRAA